MRSLYEEQFELIPPDIDVGRILGVYTLRNEYIFIGFQENMDSDLDRCCLRLLVAREDDYTDTELIDPSEVPVYDLHENVDIQDKELWLLKMRMLYHYPEVHGRNYLREKNKNLKVRKLPVITHKPTLAITAVILCGAFIWTVIFDVLIYPSFKVVLFFWIIELIVFFLYLMRPLNRSIVKK